MKQTIKKISLATLVICLLLVSCSKKSKDSTPTPTPETKTQLLTGKNWKVTAVTINPGFDFSGNGVLITDYYAYSMATGNACQLDNILNFNINGNYTDYEGATLCDPADPQLYDSGTWSFLNNEATLSFQGEYTIVTLNSTTLKLKDYFDTDGDGTNETEFNITYTKQ